MSSVFGRKMMQVDVSKLQEQFQPYQGKGQKVLEKLIIGNHRVISNIC